MTPRVHHSAGPRPRQTEAQRIRAHGPLANDNGVSWRRLLGEALLLGTGIVGVVLALVAMGD